MLQMRSADFEAAFCLTDANNYIEIVIITLWEFLNGVNDAFFSVFITE